MRKLSILIAGLAMAGSVLAESGRTGGTTLTRTQSAAPAALGGAYAAVNGTIDGMTYNPASLAALPCPQIQATYLRGFAQDSLGSLRYAHAFVFGSVFTGVDYFDAGPIDVNLSNGTQGVRRAEQDSVGSLGFAIGRRSPVSIGATLKAYRFVLAEESRATGVAVDSGVLWKTPLAGLNIGASETSAGSDVKFEQKGDPLPLTGRAGLSYTLDFARFRKLRDYPYQIQAIVDGVTENKESASVRAGLEVTRLMNDGLEQLGRVSLRGGYQSKPATVTMGLGFWIGGFGLDYAFNILNDISEDVHRATVSWRFLGRADAVAEGGEPKPLKRRKVK